MRTLTIIAVAIVAICVSASPAAADEAGPTNYESRIVEAPGDGLTARVIGGDAFLEITVTPGRTVEVPGYAEEPYLRIDADGTIERNVNSPATYLNDDRLGTVSIPAFADPEAEASWEVVATGGRFSWHDHRIHWMVPEPPAEVQAQDEPVFIWAWEVPVVVDGRPAVIAGDLTWLPDRSPVLPAVLAIAAAAAFVAVWWFRPRDLGILTIAVAATAGFSGWQVSDLQPSGSATIGPGNVAPATAAALALIATSALRRRTWPALVVNALAAGALAAWALSRLDVMWRPLLPTSSPGLYRTATALAAGVGVGIVLVLLAVAAAPGQKRPPTSASAEATE